MKDNLSIVITIIVIVLLMIIFPLYNFFERQDDMSYNLVLKATTNFVDEVINNGYIDQDMYNRFVTELGNTGNVYDIQIEAHRRVLTKDPENFSNDIYTEQSFIDYNDDIFETLNTGDQTSVGTDVMSKTLKNNIYKLNEKDKIYVDVKNSSTTMAGSLFNIIIPASNKTRIKVKYGGIIRNNAWSKVDATYVGHKQAPGAPSVIWNSSGTQVGDNKSIGIKKEDFIYDRLKATSTAFNGANITHYFWEIYEDGNKESSYHSYDAGVYGTLNLEEAGINISEYFIAGNSYKFQVYAVDNEGYKSEITNFQVDIEED